MVFLCLKSKQGKVALKCKVRVLSVVLQQDKHIQINQWVFIYSQSKVIKAAADKSIDETLEVVQLNELNNKILWHMVGSYPEIITANQLLVLLNDEKVTRNKLYQSIAKLRRIFDDRTHNATYIETVPRKGYSWLVEPFNRDETSNDKVLYESSVDDNHDTKYQQDEGSTITSQINTDSDNQVIIKNEIVNDESVDLKINTSDENTGGILTQNIFDDLGFMKNNQDDEIKEVESSVNEKELEPVKNIKPKKYRWLWMSLLFIVVLICGYIFYKPQPPVIFVASDKLYISPIVIHEKSNDISPQALNKVQWWIKQKLHHIPAMTVLSTGDKNKVPRIDSVIERKEQLIKITLTFVSKQADLLPQKMFIIVKDKIDAKSIIGDDFNHRVTQLITGVENTIISNDVCNLDSFITSQHALDSCLVDIHQQYKNLLSILNNENKTDEDETSTINTLEVLGQKTITAYKNNSLGYQILASFYQESEAFDKAHEQLLLAMERNQNEPEIIKALSESYRRIGEFNRSLLLVEALLNRNVDKQYALYWKAYDLVALGYLYKAQKIIGENDLELKTLREKVYFFGINYNQLNNVLNDVENYDTQTLSFISEIISDDDYCSVRKQVEACIEETNNNINVNFPISKWKAAASYLTGKDIEEGYELIRNDQWLAKKDNNLIGSGDRVFFIPSLANMLIKMDRIEEANELLNRLIVFIQSSNTNQMYSLTLAEAYTLLGHHSDALNQMEKLLAQGWLPNAKYQIWALADNPNFEAIKHQWQFLNLLELIDNRRKLIKLRIDDLKKVE